MEVRQLKPEDYSEARKQAIAEKEQKEQREAVETYDEPVKSVKNKKNIVLDVNFFKDHVDKYLVTYLDHPNKVVKGHQIWVKCTGCQNKKLATYVYDNRVRKFTDEKLMLDTYKCRDCRKEVK